jgi:hypothetical protein
LCLSVIREKMGGLVLDRELNVRGPKNSFVYLRVRSSARARQDKGGTQLWRARMFTITISGRVHVYWYYVRRILLERC